MPEDLTKTAQRSASKEERIPQDRDMVWESIAVPLLAFLSKPRDWKALMAWRRTNRWKGGRLRNCLAWLENQGLAHTMSKNGKVVWVRSKDADPRPTS